MYLTIEEMKSVLYAYQMNEIAENDNDILLDGIQAAIAEVRAYFDAANARRETAVLSAQQYEKWKIYDVDAIFSAEGADRNAFVLRLVKRVAAWNICELSNVDVIYEHVKERYLNAIDILQKIAGTSAEAPMFIAELPSPVPGDIDGDGIPDVETSPALPFRSGSRPKFHHE